MRRFIQGSRLCCSVAYRYVLIRQRPVMADLTQQLLPSILKYQVPIATYRNKTRQTVKSETLDIMTFQKQCQAPGGTLDRTVSVLTKYAEHLRRISLQLSIPRFFDLLISLLKPPLVYE